VDAMNMIFIKEMDMVPKFMTLHPMTLMIASDNCEISDWVSLTRQDIINLHGWVNSDIGG